MRWNIFRYLADLSHLASICILVWAIHKNKSAEGMLIRSLGRVLGHSFADTCLLFRCFTPHADALRARIRDSIPGYTCSINMELCSRGICMECPL